MVIGATGPQVLQSRSDAISVLDINDSGDALWTGSVNDMIKLNQLFWLSVDVYRPTSSNDDIGIIEIYMNATGYNSMTSPDNQIFFDRHDKHEVYCSLDECTEFYIFGQSSIRYRSYAVSIRFASVDAKFIQPDGSLKVRINLHTINAEVPEHCM